MTAIAAVIYIITLVFVLLGFAVLLISAWRELCNRLKPRRSNGCMKQWPANPGWVQSVKENDQ